MDWRLLLSHPVWQVSEVVLALIGTAFAVWSFRVDRLKNKRELTIYQLYQSTILKAPAKPVDKLQILYDGQPAESLRSVIFELRNTGKDPILPEEILAPIELVFTQGAIIIHSEITTISPPDLDIAIVPSDSSRVQFSKALLNEGDYAIGEITLLNSADFSFKALGRIVGVPGIVVKPRTTTFFGIRIALLSIVLSFIVVVVGFFGIDFLAPGQPLYWSYLLSINLTTLGVMGYDKTAVLSNRPRVPEVVLAILGLLGGGPGLLTSALLYRHKWMKTSMRLIFVISLVWFYILVSIVGGLS